MRSMVVMRPPSGSAFANHSVEYPPSVPTSRMRRAPCTREHPRYSRTKTPNPMKLPKRVGIINVSPDTQYSLRSVARNAPGPGT